MSARRSERVRIDWLRLRLSRNDKIATRVRCNNYELTNFYGA